MGTDLQERNREIGKALQQARKRMKKSIAACAAHLGTSRRRYADIERGAVFIAAAELEEMVRFLRVPPYEVWPQQLLNEGARQIIVDASPGESVLVIVNIAPDAAKALLPLETGDS